MTIATSSLWTHADVARPSGSLGVECSCDVCVVGAGIAGLTTAFLLACEGRSVLVLDARDTVADGETAYTTAHLASVLDDRFSALEAKRGLEVTRLAHEAHADAIDAIEAIAKTEEIDCDFVRVDGYLFPGTSDTPEIIDAEESAARRAGVAVERIDEVPLPMFRVGPCLRFAGQGQFHPLKYLAGVAQALKGRGGCIATGCPVDKVEGGPRCRVTLKDGRSVQCGAVVLATNAPLNGGVRVNAKIAAYTTYALAAEVPLGLAYRALYWDTEDPYHYVRLCNEPGEGANEYLIVGGEDHKTGQATDQAERWDRLEAWIRLRFPDMGAVRQRWSGQVFETLDGLALIGPDPGGDANVYLATGDSGMGLTHGTIAGLLLRDLILGRSNPWASLFDPARLPIKTAGTAVAETMNAVHQYKDWVTGGDVVGVDEVPLGEGAVVRRGLKKLAVYRDNSGKLHEMSATCPHMGCVVRWNGGEGTWDCPCHGSRFTAEGRCLHGPATGDLTPVESSERAAR